MELDPPLTYRAAASDKTDGEWVEARGYVEGSGIRQITR
jgi:hypothetical protein